MNWSHNSSRRNKHLNLLVRIKFLDLFLYCSKYILKNLLVRTKFYWSWAREPVFIVRTAIEVGLLRQVLLYNDIDTKVT